MHEMSAARSDPDLDAARVTVEVVAWVTRFVGGDGTRRRLFDEAIAPDATVRSVLSGLSDRYATLREVLWVRDTGELSEHIEVLVNDAVLGLTHTLESAVRDGDRVTLIGQYTGGKPFLCCLPEARDAGSARVRSAPDGLTRGSRPAAFQCP